MLDPLKEYSGPPVCGHCGYGIMPKDTEYWGYEHNDVNPNEPAPHGWVHEPAEVDWENHYCNGPECGNDHVSHHTAYPHDGGSVEMHEHAAGEFLTALNTKHDFDSIVKNSNLGRQFD